MKKLPSKTVRGFWSRKAFEVQFHWIFIMIAGAIILTFFITVVTKYQSVSEERFSLVLSKQLETILSGATIAKQTTQHIQLPLPLKTSCTETCACSFSTGTKVTQLKGTSLFSPSVLAGKELIYTTHDWNIPFRAGVFVYLTDDQQQYALVYDPGDSASTALLTKITQQLPQELSVKNISITLLSSIVLQQENKKIHLIFLNTLPDAFALRNAQENSGVIITVITAAGGVQFYARNTVQESNNVQIAQVPIASTWTSDAELVGAIFSDTQRSYACNLRQAYARAQWIVQVQNKRLDALQSRCSTTKIKETLAEFEKTMKVLSQEIGTQGEAPAVLTLRALQHDLAQENQQLAKANCPTIY